MVTKEDFVFSVEKVQNFEKDIFENDISTSERCFKEDSAH